MLELLVGIDAAQRLTGESVAEPMRRRRVSARRSRIPAARGLVSGAISALAGLLRRTGTPSAGRPCSEARSD
jgi:hypothetical protein